MSMILRSERILITLISFLSIFVFSNINAQENILCKINSDNFDGKIESAVLVHIGNEYFVQIKAVDDDKIMYMYLKTEKLKDEMPVTLDYRDRDSANTQTPDAEIVWAPEGPDRPQWNSVEGKVVVTEFNREGRTISGEFDFVVEKFSYSSRANAKRPNAEIKDGKFSNVHFKIE